MKSKVFLFVGIFVLLFHFVWGQSEEEHKIAPELVGKWCYLPASESTLENITSSCITLNADGSYDAQLDRNAMSGSSLPGLPSGDAGTWWVIGNKLYYNSNSQGKGSFDFRKANHPRIEKTPSLIIQGAVFCSPSPRDPW